MEGEQLELEGIAQAVRKKASIAPDEIVSGPTLIERLLKTRVRVAPTLGSTACLTFDGRFYRVILREVSDDSNFDCAHELSHFALRTIARYFGPEEERYANALAAAILVPATIVRAAVGQHGAELAAIDPLADFGQMSQTAAHLRLGEILGDERAVLTKKNRNRMIRSQGHFRWGKAPLIGFLKGERDIPGLVKVQLHGGIDAGRVAFLKR